MLVIFSFGSSRPLVNGVARDKAFMLGDSGRDELERRDAVVV
jgi:hypothetical protein